MLKIGLSYYDALVNSDGKAAPFADDCVRHENGLQTTGNPRRPLRAAVRWAPWAVPLNWILE